MLAALVWLLSSHLLLRSRNLEALGCIVLRASLPAMLLADPVA